MRRLRAGIGVAAAVALTAGCGLAGEPVASGTSAAGEPLAATSTTTAPTSEPAPSTSRDIPASKPEVSEWMTLLKRDMESAPTVTLTVVKRDTRKPANDYTLTSRGDAQGVDVGNVEFTVELPDGGRVEARFIGYAKFVRYNATYVDSRGYEDQAALRPYVDKWLALDYKNDSLNRFRPAPAIREQFYGEGLTIWDAKASTMDHTVDPATGDPAYLIKMRDREILTSADHGDPHIIRTVWRSEGSYVSYTFTDWGTTDMATIKQPPESEIVKQGEDEDEVDLGQS